MAEGLARVGAVITLIGGVVSLACFYLVASVYAYGTGTPQDLRDLVAGEHGILLGLVISLMGLGLGVWGLAAVGSKEARAAALLDFSVARGFLRQGGFREDVAPCPACEAPLPLPPRGTLVRCGACGAVVSGDEVVRAFQKSRRPAPAPRGTGQ